CVAPDMVGCGLSDKPQDFEYRLANHSETVVELVESLGLRRVHLVLHDWGGAFGMGFARRRPELVASITALNTAAFPGGAMPWRIGVCRTPLLGTLMLRGLGVFSKAAVRTTTARGPLDPLVRRAYLEPYANWHDRVAVSAFVHDIPTTTSHPTYDELAATADALPMFRATPVQLVWGERDWCFTPRFREEWQRRLPHAESHPIADAAHFVFEDAPEEVTERLADFLARVERDASVEVG
ncbi:MAG: alpha/beta fold hydrolase, partial [Planctomycetota bacterium]